MRQACGLAIVNCNLTMSMFHLGLGLGVEKGRALEPLALPLVFWSLVYPPLRQLYSSASTLRASV